MSTTEPPSEQELEYALSYIETYSVPNAAAQVIVRAYRTLRATVAKLEAQIAVLREAVSHTHNRDEQSRIALELMRCRKCELLANTAQAAAEYEASVKAPLEAQVAALMSYVRWLDNHGSLEIEADDAETMLERYSVAEIKYKDEQQTRFMQGNTAAAAEAHDAGVRRRATAAVKSVRDEAVKLADHHCVVQVLRWLDRAIAALSTAGKEET